MYSHHAPDLHGESMAPQAHSDAPWIDEVQQQVAVNNVLNGQAPWNRPYFQHQAGAYQRDGDYTTVPFYSPSFARHCEGNTCTFASWGTQAHVPTPFTAPVTCPRPQNLHQPACVSRTSMAEAFLTR